MMKMKHLLLALVTSLSLSVAIVPSSAHALPTTPALQFAKTWKQCGGGLLGIPPWYKHLPMTNACTPKITKLNQVWVIALNVFEILLRVSGLAAVGYLIWGGFKYMKSQGDPNRLSEAKSAILNAIIGLGIVIAAVLIVQFVAGSLA